MAGIYIHVPFCKQACYYCDFHFSTNLLTREKLVASLGEELLLQKNYFRNPEAIQTIYFGGGTPSILEQKEIERLLHAIAKHYTITPSPEITLEANPDDLTVEKLRQLKASGINRLSIGIQSFDNEVLKFLNRAHDAAMATSCIKMAQDLGFSNISVDLIYGIPQQDDAMWQKHVLEALSLQPQHLSAYALTVEEKTVLGKWTRQGKFHPATNDYAAQQMDILIDALEKRGYEHYEVSNFALPGFHAVHNSSYWQQKPYLGIGPSAHSYNGTTRQYNISNNSIYIKSIEDHKVPCETEVLSREDKINEIILTTLRTSKGCDTQKIRHDFEFDLLDHHKLYIEQIIQLDFACIEGDGTLKLTRKGRMLADKISSDLFIN